MRIVEDIRKCKTQKEALNIAARLILGFSNDKVWSGNQFSNAEELGNMLTNEISHILESITAETEQLSRAKEEAVCNQDFETASHFRDDINKIRNQFKEQVHE
jgi:protein-arginine kinase activator protein McsA